MAVDEAAAAATPRARTSWRAGLRPLVAALAAAGPADGLRAAVALRYNRSEATRAPLQPSRPMRRAAIAAVLEEAVTATRC